MVKTNFLFAIVRIRALLCALGFVLCFSSSAFAVEAGKSLTFSGKDYTWELTYAKKNQNKETPLPVPPEVKESVLTSGGVNMPALRFTLRKTPNLRFTVSLKTGKAVNMFDEYPTQIVSMETSAEELPGKFLDFYAVNASGQTWLTPKNSEQDKEKKLWRFKNDITHQPRGDWGAYGDTRNITEFKMVFDLEKLPADEIEIKLGDMTLTSENFWADRPEQERKFREWIHWLDTWQPDYSDSSKFLLPPETGRISEGLPLTINGKPNAEIILRDDPDHVVKTAAEELQRWFREISGAELPVLTEPGQMPVKIYLNSAEGEKKFAKDMKFLKAESRTDARDGFFVRTEGKNIYIGGPIPKSTLNGAYRFIENNTDLIWAKLNPDFGTVYTENPNITAIWADAVSKPRARFRGLRAWNNKSGMLWKTRNCLNDAYLCQYGSLLLRGSMGIIESYLNHEEFYALTGNSKNGYKRQKVEYTTAQACLREEAWKHTLNDMLAIIARSEKSGKKDEVIGWGPEDNWNFCCCEECLKPLTLPNGKVVTPEDKRFRCNQYWLFANRLAKEIKKKHPDMMFGVLAYFMMEPAPDFQLEDNIYAIYAPLSSRGDYHNPVYAPTNPRIYTNREDLLRQGLLLDQYDYFFHSPHSEVFRQETLDNLEHGMAGLSYECYSRGWEFQEGNGQELWVDTRIMWDPDTDPMKLRKYYIRRVYHEGAPVVEEYIFSMLSSLYRGMRQSCTISWPYEKVFENGRGEEFRKKFAEALPKIKNQRARINFGRLVRDFEKRYHEWKSKQDVKSAKPPEAGEKVRAKMSACILGCLQANIWHAPVFSPLFNDYMTTMELDGKFIDGLRISLKYQNTKKTKKYYSVIDIGTKNSKDFPECRLALSGKITFKIKSLRPGLPDAPLPFFCIRTNTGEEYMNNKLCCKRIAPDVVSVEFSPEGKSINLDNVTGFGVMATSDMVNPKLGSADFFLYDFDIVPEKIIDSSNLSGLELISE